ncbi:DUF6155 family protein [Christiangramia forsetii]|uniref:Uncharacterized protein n=2 Tax=Christiangramia forsetii TaxID=411153 RepID=A0M1K8_CHRFK|nr:DUF6155 family protein [Christiangramia forsetii]GGG42286.1 hypothetical protein GCM10011532_27620 [Christiangramia forsetii]CAL66503.1 hypothetical protein GFO_1530 [Christiangramia forsetii KT0803]
MSKRDFKKYIKSLEKEDLEEQILDLYNRFDDVKVFYNFVFNPNEDKLVKEAKFKISKEYYPPNNRKPKKRRSVAHKLIKHFLKLEMEPYSLADVMFYNIEIAQTFSNDIENITESFEKSMLKSYEQAADYVISNAISSEFGPRINKIAEEADSQNWTNAYQFDRVRDRFL